MKYGFVIILIKIAGYNYPEALGTAKGQEKQRVSDGLPLAVEIFLTARQGLRLPSSFPPLTCVGNLLLHFISSQRALHLALRFLRPHVPPRFCFFFGSVVNPADLHERSVTGSEASTLSYDAKRRREAASAGSQQRPAPPTRGGNQPHLYLRSACRLLCSRTCRCICRTSRCSGRWRRCCSCRAPLHTRPHLHGIKTRRINA